MDTKHSCISLTIYIHSGKSGVVMHASNVDCQNSLDQFQQRIIRSRKSLKKILNIMRKLGA